MAHHYEKPNQKLTKYVRTILILDSLSSSHSDNLPVVTNGMSALIYKTEKGIYGEDKILQLSLFGKSIPFDVLRMSKDATLVIYFFYPFVLTPLFNIAASKLVNTSIHLDNWNAHISNALKAQLFYSATAEQQVEILDNLLIQQAKDNYRECEIIQYATDQMMCSPDPEILSIIQKDLKLTERTFQRLFKKFVGVTPGQYRRICQFQLSFSQVKSGKYNTLTGVAHDNGFADQSHFIRTFKEFTKTTPGTYLKTGLNDKK